MLANKWPMSLLPSRLREIREFLRRDQCFVLHGHGLEDYPNYAELFGDIATLIDLTDCNAADKLRTALSNT